MKKVLFGCVGNLLFIGALCSEGQESSLEKVCRFPVVLDMTLALDDFRGIFSGSWGNTFGSLAALNMQIDLPSSFSGALGGSYGLYDWAGRASTPYKNSKTYQQQGFITAAVSWQTPKKFGWHVGFAYDWMLNKNFGLFALNPFFDQVRGQVGYVMGSSDEIGVWGSYAIHTADEELQGLPIQFKGVSQANLFWSHYFPAQGNLMLWVGTPYQRGLLYTEGRAGTFIVGAQFSVPANDFFRFEGHGSYMGSRGRSGVVPSKNYSANLCFGLTYSWEKCSALKGTPMSLANNSSFMTDTNQNF